MGMLSRIRADIVVKVLVSLVFAFLIAVIPNYQYFIYRGFDPLSKDDVEKQSVSCSIGYLPAEDIENAKSVEEIKNGSYCTISVKGKDLKPTGYYKILNESKAGVDEGSGRKTPDVVNYKYKSNSFAVRVMNNVGPQYGEFYVAALENGEKVIVLLDQTLLPFDKSKTIQLPIGQVQEKYPVHFFQSISSQYDIGENGTWYVDMAGSNFVNSTQMELLGVIRFGGAVAAFVLFYVICSLVFRKLY